jgi:putative membrane protein insertion efficiency factor
MTRWDTPRGGAGRWSLAATATAKGALWLYKRLISPILPPACRFYPTCSDYAAEAFQTHSFGRALGLSLRRLAKCGPWHRGGYDPVPPAGGRIAAAQSHAHGKRA